MSERLSNEEIAFKASVHVLGQIMIPVCYLHQIDMQEERAETALQNTVIWREKNMAV